MRSLRAPVVLLFVASVACAPGPSDAGVSAGSSSTGAAGADATSDMSSSGSTVTTAGSSLTSTSSGADTSTVGTTGSTSASYIDPSAFDTSDAIECHMLHQDCGEGERCSPWANDGGEEWNATRCVPSSPDAVGVGESCQIEGHERTGVDNCGLGSLCIDVATGSEPADLRCVEICVGIPDDFETPTCEDTALRCSIDGTRAVCLPPGVEG